MKARYYLYIGITVVVTFLMGFLIGQNSTEKPPGTIKETRDTIVDAIHYNEPKPQEEVTLGSERYTLPTCYIYGGGSGGEPRQRDSVEIKQAASIDSTTIGLPIIQRHYSDSTYEAWVSGPINPQLDSVRVLARTTIITKEIWKPPKRWHLGVTAGYGYGAKGFQPYVGVGITYSLFSF